MDIPKLSSTERLILELLAGEEMFGLQLVEQSKGALKRGTVYVTLGRMQDKGYVESWTEKQPAGAIGAAETAVSSDRLRTSSACCMGSRRSRAGPSAETEARMKIPGGLLHRLAVCLCSAKTLERVVEPAIADLQSELAAAQFSPPLQRARILVVGYLAILVAMLMCACELAAADERRPLIRTFDVERSGIVSGAGMLQIGLVVATVVIGGAPWPRPIHYAFLIPIDTADGVTHRIHFGPGCRFWRSRGVDGCETNRRDDSIGVFSRLAGNAVDGHAARKSGVSASDI